MFLVLKSFENMWVNQETLLFPQQKCFSISWETFLFPVKQILFPQQCFPRWANRETLIGNIMFPQHCFLVCPGLCQAKNNLLISSGKMSELISLSHAMRPGLQIRHFWVAKSLFLTITFHQKKQDKTFCF